MIVKNEETVLARCLDSVKGLMDEIIIVDTGSTDRTKEIASRYTNLIYDFPWCDDFAAARNFSFSKATKEYIYAPDADEYLDAKNYRRFSILKDAMMPEVEIVQMKYITPSRYNTVQNSSSELRPKLFRRLRTFTWINPVHETVRLDPVVFDSDIEILHLPDGSHGKRDFSIFQHAFEQSGTLPSNIMTMYAKELLKCGTPEDFANAAPFFEKIYEDDVCVEAVCILAHHYRVQNDTDRFFSVALKNVAVDGCSEVCCELGAYYFDRKDYNEAALWYYNAAFEVTPALNVESGGGIPLAALAECYEKWADSKEASLKAIPPSSRGNFAADVDTIATLRQNAADYRRQAAEWSLPQL
jgi:glycosyltransferase involved in cell wall biosynthesis